ncbi:flagellar export chaperone FliS [Zhenpiania hominis]|uniref:Flagellar export chaperone FliS n=1 Tax=Zhenpiania hominis TaxID=2763644 RepID=A0A923NHX3_9FIRM|nr:flagellar export chaperone FliS [Zhenpiania hominis]MBC6678336.1 flagellar export chaperone FliS [Zhenpiania hominis]
MSLNGYQQYKEQSVMTMTSGEMLLLLYDELLKRLTRAELALEKEDYPLFEQSVKRSQEIVKYLMDTLNFKYSISQELRRMYDFFLYELSRIQAGRKKEIIAELKPLVRELREAFEEAGKQQNG